MTAFYHLLCIADEWLFCLTAAEFKRPLNVEHFFRDGVTNSGRRKFRFRKQKRGHLSALFSTSACVCALALYKSAAINFAQEADLWSSKESRPPNLSRGSRRKVDRRSAPSAEINYKRSQKADTRAVYLFHKELVWYISNEIQQQTHTPPYL